MLNFHMGTLCSLPFIEKIVRLGLNECSCLFVNLYEARLEF